MAGNRAPLPALEDEVLCLRPLASTDAAAWHAGEDEQIRHWFQFPRPSSRRDVSEAIQAWAHSWASDGPVRHFGAWLRSGAVLVGGVEARDRGEGAAYISYVTFADHRRQGHASRAVRLVSDYALEALPVERLVITTDATNTASRGVASAAGFRLDGPADPDEHVELGEMLRYVRT